MDKNIKETFEKIGKYNNWEGQLIQTGYKRQEYLDKIIKYIVTRLVKVLIGQRRA